MDRDRFIQVAPLYYAARFAQRFKGADTATAQSLWDPDIDHGMLFDEAMKFLIAKGLVYVIGDDFGPPLYRRTDFFDEALTRLLEDDDSPFSKAALDGGGTWLSQALNAVNKAYRDLKIVDEDFNEPDREWEPIPLERTDENLQRVSEELDQAIDQIKGDNGYASTLPGEREFVIQALSNTSQQLKTENATTWGYLQRNAFEPLKTLMRRFKGAALGVAAAGVRAAFETWIKNQGLEWLNRLWTWFWS